MKTKVCILFGGNSIEREISILSKEQLIKNLDHLKYNIIKIELPQDNNNDWVKKLIDEKPDIVLSALHGGLGENGSVQGLLECLNIPYVGSKVMSSSISMNKNMSKIIMRANYIPVADDIFISKNDDIIKYTEKIKKLGFPLVVKPNNGGASIGISIVNNYNEFLDAFIAVKDLNDDILVEKYIYGKEVTCGILETDNGLEVLPILDIDVHDSDKFYNFNAKYSNDNTKISFSKLPKYLQIMIKEIAKKVFTTLECKGYAIVDMLIFQDEIYVLEINTLPGLTSHSIIPKSAAMDSSFKSFLDRLIYFAIIH